MSRRKHLIIGAGAAGLSALDEIRRLTPGGDGEVKVVTMEEHLPYLPASLPYLLSGRITEAELWRKDENDFKDLKTTLVTGKEVTQVFPGDRRVIYRDGSSENYDTLLIASGSEPAKPSIQGLDVVGARDFRTLADCRGLLRELAGKKDVAILGAGIVGMKMASALLQNGYRVSLVEREDHVLPLYFNEEAADYIRDIFIEHHVRFFTDHAVTAVKKEGGKIRIALSSGSSLEADVLINATGTRSRVSFLEGTGIRVNDGIGVDRRMRTGVDQIYAAGDVAEAQDFFTGQPKISAIIPSAVRQGRVAGANMAGGDAEYEGAIPSTALNFLGTRAFSIGLPMPPDSTGQILKEKDDRKRIFKKLVLHADRLVGAMFVNEPVDPGIILHLIRRRVDLSPYKEALFDRTKPLSDPWLSCLKFSQG